MSVEIKWWLLLTAVTLTVFVVACDTQTGASEGVTVYESPNFSGSSHIFASSHTNLFEIASGCPGVVIEDFGGRRTLPGNWDGCVSSIMVPPGWEATLYSTFHFFGSALEVTSDNRDLGDVQGPCDGDWDDCTSSIRVSGPR